ncbi:transmembrane protein 14A [Paramisgurnus dabryanus]|uniref:transmembrane protein 14A n=1 Tax=Paramisgurnus dabryanus TaxID=90735 RepID=UPI0031F42338
MAVDWLGFAYAAAIALGGFVGYKRKGSVMSLIAGLFFGIWSAYGAYKITYDSYDYWTSLTASGALAVVMGMRFRKSGKLMPAGIMTALSLLMVFRLLIL